MRVTYVGMVFSYHFSLCSAAKAPFLARFRVAKCGTAKVEQLNIKGDPGKGSVQQLSHEFFFNTMGTGKGRHLKL